MTGTRTFTLKQSPSRFDISGVKDGDHMKITMTRKSWLRYARERLGWQLWKRWRKLRIRAYYQAEGPDQ